MSEQLHRNNTYESQALQTPEVYDAPQMATEDEIRIAKTAAAAEESAREEARQPLIDEARAAVEAAMADMNQQPVLGRKQKLRQFAGLNAYSKKKPAACSRRVLLDKISFGKLKRRTSIHSMKIAIRNGTQN